MSYLFRAAAASDLKAITDIYNASVVEGGATADLEPRTLDQRRAWVESHKPPYGVFVVEVTDDGDDAFHGDEEVARERRETVQEDRDDTAAGEVVAFGALSVFYDRAGYDGVTDLAYYIAPQWRHRGVGTFLLDRLLDKARSRRMRKAIGIIFADNAGSIALMRRFGFTRFGLLPAAATDATGVMHDMSYWYLDL
ncbi:GNAT family N-acetyltransferase [Bifidobacterium stellenboschense]|uniref:Phosphinothricin N-acetyltransferase n=1 Tax=Bifidobacterium stellenboschense TaxID=762211 RepID=A0A087DZL1_9BIFI|nr:GNAT family N-acetyltransferase [Bifidobacterium stellenboschense]KFJ00962.1 Phosphinothricin N-acetyltransferase [Bifidobacterium stellenboschense]